MTELDHHHLSTLDGHTVPFPCHGHRQVASSEVERWWWTRQFVECNLDGATVYGQRHGTVGPSRVERWWWSRSVVPYGIYRHLLQVAKHAARFRPVIYSVYRWEASSILYTLWNPSTHTLSDHLAWCSLGASHTCRSAQWCMATIYHTAHLELEGELILALILILVTRIIFFM